MCMVPVGAIAVPTLGLGWDNTLADWKASLAPASDSAQATPSVSWDHLADPSKVTMTFPNDGTQQPIGRVYTEAADFIGKGYTTIAGVGPDQLNIHFTLTSPDVAPNPYGLAFYFKSADGDVWYAAKDAVQAKNAQDYSIFIGNESAWVSAIGNTIHTGLEGWSDFSDIKEIGFELLGGNYGGIQNYEFSNIYLTVPEPETVWMILAVLVSLGITFRKQIGEFAGQMKARFVA